MLTKKNLPPDNVVRCMQMMPRYLPGLANQRVVSLIETMFWHSQKSSKEFKCLLDGDCKEESIGLEMPFVQSQCQQLYNMMGTELWMDTQHLRCKEGWIKVKVSWIRARTDEWLVESVFHNLTYIRKKWELNVTEWYLHYKWHIDWKKYDWKEEVPFRRVRSQRKNVKKKKYFSYVKNGKCMN